MLRGRDEQLSWILGTKDGQAQREDGLVTRFTLQSKIRIKTMISSTLKALQGEIRLWRRGELRWAHQCWDQGEVRQQHCDVRPLTIVSRHGICHPLAPCRDSLQVVEGVQRTPREEASWWDDCHASKRLCWKKKGHEVTQRPPKTLHSLGIRLYADLSSERLSPQHLFICTLIITNQS